MNAETEISPSPEDDPRNQTNPVESQPTQADPRLKALDMLITTEQEIQYKGKHLKDDRVVGEFVKDHRPLRTALLGAKIFLYSDPCTCCIPAYGLRDKQWGIEAPTDAIEYVRAAVSRDEAPDLIFVNEAIYRGALAEIGQLSPQTKLIVACDQAAPTSASQLRNQGIPAIDDQDYFNCAPLNAIIALTVFDELMAAAD